MSKEKTFNFEQSMARLEEIVKLLEKGDAPLDSLLELYEEGTELIRKCSKALDAAEQKVTKLARNGQGEIEQVPFAAEE
jgi:exodeoxyribonuclease VII small subunit